MSEETVTVPVPLSRSDIQMLAEERESDALESSPLADFIERILHLAADTADSMGRLAHDMKRVNPYSVQTEF